MRTAINKYGRIIGRQLARVAVVFGVLGVLTVVAVAWSLFTGNPNSSEPVMTDSSGWGSESVYGVYPQTGAWWSPIGIANACGLGASSCFKCHNGKRAALQSMDKKTTPWHPDHKKTNYSCAGCHKGNPRLIKKNLAHAKLIVDPRSTPDRCMTCHKSGKTSAQLLQPYKKVKP